MTEEEAKASSPIQVYRYGYKRGAFNGAMLGFMIASIVYTLLIGR